MAQTLIFSTLSGKVVYSDSAVCAGIFSNALAAALINREASSPAITTAIPGLVQNCPAPIVREAAHPEASSSPRAAALSNMPYDFTDQVLATAASDARRSHQFPPSLGWSAVRQVCAMWDVR